MKQVLSNMSDSPKSLARLNDTIVVADGYSRVKYYDCMSKRSGSLGMDFWALEQFRPVVRMRRLRWFYIEGDQQNSQTEPTQLPQPNGVEQTCRYFEDTRSCDTCPRKNVECLVPSFETAQDPQTQIWVWAAEYDLGDQNDEYRFFTGKFSVVVNASDKRFASPTGQWRTSCPTLPSAEFYPQGMTGGEYWNADNILAVPDNEKDDMYLWAVANNKLEHLWAVCAYEVIISPFPQLGQDNAGSVPVIDFDAQRRDIYICRVSDNNADATAGPFRRWIQVLNNVDTVIPIEASKQIVTDALGESLFITYPPPPCRFVIEALGQIWMAGGIESSAGTVTVQAPDETDFGYRLVGDGTAFFDGMFGGEITLEDGRKLIVARVNASTQTMYLQLNEETVTDADLDLEFAFTYKSMFGLYFSTVGNPHSFPLENYVQVPGEVTALGAIGRYILLWVKGGVLYRYSVDNPELGCQRVSGDSGCEAQNSILNVDGKCFWFDGYGISVTDGQVVKPITHSKIKTLMQMVDQSKVPETVSAFDRASRKMIWHFPTVGLTGNFYGVEIDPDTLDISPVWRPDVSAMWSDQYRTRFGTTGQYTVGNKSLVYDVVDGQTADGVPIANCMECLVVKHAVVSGTHLLTLSPSDGKSFLADTAAQCLPLIIRVTSQTDAVVMVRSLTPIPESTQVVAEVPAVFAAALASVPVQAGLTLSGYLGGILASYGPKWHDFDSSRYLHKVYDIDIDFMPLDYDVTMVVDWYTDLNGATPVKTVSRILRAGQTKIQIPFDWRPAYQIGFRIRFYGRGSIRIQHYILTWATQR